MTRADDDGTKTEPLARPHEHDSTDSLLEESLVARYQELSALGEGGMGKVSLCLDRAIGREVAMKTVHPAYASHAEMRARFVREARVQARLEHPAVVPVYDFGIDGAGRTFFTMKRVRGITLAEVVEGYRTKNAELMRTYNRHRLLAAFVQVCLAIGYAHERGVLHRDLKPSNVMLGGYGETYVLDWGLAKITALEEDDLPTNATGTTDSGRADATAAGHVVIGTPAYAPPEIVRGESADERTDVYVLGSILFEILTYETLHGGGTAQEMMARSNAGAEARPSVRAPSLDVPPELEAACVLACARERRDRLGSARALADLVEAYLSGDRDLELRRELAEMHLGRAREAFARAIVPGAPLAERTVALEEAGRAVALAPENDRARAVLVDMLTRPPAPPPPEVLAQVESEQASSHVLLVPRARNAFVFMLLVSLGGIYGLGVRSWALVAVGLLFFVLAIIIAGYASLRRSTAFTQTAFAACSALGIGMVSLFFGPLMIVPTLAASIAISSVLQTRIAHRATILVVYLVAMIVPSVLALLHLHPVRLASIGSLLTMSPAAVELHPDLSILAVTGCNALVVLTGALHAARYRDAMNQLALASHVQSWQLAQVTLPSAGRRSGAPPRRASSPSVRRSRGG